MGWWSEDIMGGDFPLDIVDFIEDVFDIDDENFIYPMVDMNDYVKDRSKDLINANTVQEIFRKVLVRAGDWIGDDGEDKNIFLQVYALIAMAVGADISDEDKELFIASAVEEDDIEDWSNPDARRKVLDNFKETVRAYDGTPVVVGSKGLFEAMGEALDKADPAG